jgi:hypothetical protein
MQFGQSAKLQYSITPSLRSPEFEDEDDDEDSLSDVAFRARGLAVLSASEVGSTKRLVRRRGPSIGHNRVSKIADSRYAFLRGDRGSETWISRNQQHKASFHTAARPSVTVPINREQERSGNSASYLNPPRSVLVIIILVGCPTSGLGDDRPLPADQRERD